MSFAPPRGPPPPRVPDGWKAQFHQGYQQWYYVNLYTEQSQWEPPVSPDEAPPSYETLDQRPRTPASASNIRDGTAPQLGSNNPFNRSTQSDKSSSTDFGGLESSRGKDTQLEEDARLAAQLQAEEDARAREYGQRHGNQGPSRLDSQARGENASYYDANNPASPSLQASQSYPETSQSQSQSFRKKGGGGLLHKLASKAQEKLSRPRSSSMGYSSNQHHGTSSYGQPSYYSSQPVIHSGYGYPMMGGGHHPYQQVYYGDPHRRRHGGGGMGAGGAAALGLGGGLLGGAMLANSMHDDHDYGDGYGDGFGDGADFGGGGDFGGGDFGGGF